jgi:hypothetical protein
MTRTAKFKNGKRVEEKVSYKYSGLQRIERKLVTSLVGNTELLSLVHEDIHKKIDLSKLTKEKQIIALLYELKFLREYFSMATVTCHAIGVVHENQEKSGSSGGRKKNREVERIFLEICSNHLEAHQKLPTGKELINLFNQQVIPINELRRMKPLDLRKDDEQPLSSTQRSANAFLTRIKPLFQAKGSSK